MQEFRFLNFCTKYSSKGDINIRMKTAACFGDIFHSNKDKLKNKYTIKVYKDGYINNDNNACLLDKKEISNHIKLIKKLVPSFRHKVIEEGEDGFTIILWINAKLIYHKFILTFVRYIYEFPYNMYLLEAHRLRKYYRNASILNLFNLVKCTIKITDHGTDIHAIGSVHQDQLFMSTQKLKQRIKKACRLNDIFDIDANINLNRINNSFSRDLENWLSEEDFINKRLEAYKHNYKQIKKHSV